MPWGGDLVPWTLAAKLADTTAALPVLHVSDGIGLANVQGLEGGVPWAGLFGCGINLQEIHRLYHPKFKTHNKFGLMTHNMEKSIKFPQCTRTIFDISHIF